MPKPKREKLVQLNTLIWARQQRWLREQNDDGLKQAEMVRAALDDYMERIENDDSND